MAFIFRLSPVRSVQAVALLAALAGVLMWSSLLLTSAQSSAPPPVREEAAATLESPALQWFSNRPAALDIKVSGVINVAHGAVAILSINGTPPRVFLLGERLAQGAHLVAIERDNVVIERGSERVRFKLNTLPTAPSMPRLTQP